MEIFDGEQIVLRRILKSPSFKDRGVGSLATAYAASLSSLELTVETESEEKINPGRRLFPRLVYEKEYADVVPLHEEP